MSFEGMLSAGQSPEYVISMALPRLEIHNRRLARKRTRLDVCPDPRLVIVPLIVISPVQKTVYLDNVRIRSVSAELVAGASIESTWAFPTRKWEVQAYHRSTERELVSEVPRSQAVEAKERHKSLCFRVSCRSSIRSERLCEKERNSSERGEAIADG